jgi:hypothetical protein
VKLGSLTLSEERSLRALENTVLRRISVRDEVTRSGDIYFMRRFII